MPRKSIKRERRNQVEGSIRNFTLTRAGSSITLEILAHGEPIGTAEIGLGSIMWREPYGKRSTRVTWQHFAEWVRRGAKLG